MSKRASPTHLGLSPPDQRPQVIRGQHPLRRGWQALRHCAARRDRVRDNPVSGRDGDRDIGVIVGYRSAADRADSNRIDDLIPGHEIRLVNRTRGGRRINLRGVEPHHRIAGALEHLPRPVQRNNQPRDIGHRLTNSVSFARVPTAQRRYRWHQARYAGRNRLRNVWPHTLHWRRSGSRHADRQLQQLQADLDVHHGWVALEFDTFGNTHLVGVEPYADYSHTWSSNRITGFDVSKESFGIQWETTDKGFDDPANCACTYTLH
jgi:hypothetical protein